MKQRLYVALTAAVGLASGAVGGLLGGRSVAAPAAQESAGAPAFDPASVRQRAPSDVSKTLRDAQDRSQAERLAELEARLANAEKRGDRNGDKPDDKGPPPVDIATSREETVNDWEDRLADHDAQPRDPAWSAKEEKALQADVFGLAEQAQIKVLGADCRTNSCTATVEWKDYHTAVGNFSTLIHHPYSNNCTREVILPEPAQQDKPYQAVVLFTCGPRAPT